jgi:hypothetical protein
MLRTLFEGFLVWYLSKQTCHESDYWSVLHTAATVRFID